MYLTMVYLKVTTLYYHAKTLVLFRVTRLGEFALLGELWLIGRIMANWANFGLLGVCLL
jgi:hypothetical protein